FEPLTAAATKLLDGPHGARAQQVLRGSLAAADGQRGVELNGIALSTSVAGTALNAGMARLEYEEIEPARRATKGRTQEIRELFDEELAGAPNVYGLYERGPS